MSKNIKQLSKEIAERHNLPIPLVNEVITSQFKFMKYTIEHGDSKGYQAIHLGKFVPSDKRVAASILRSVKVMSNLMKRLEDRREIIKLLEHNEML